MVPTGPVIRDENTASKAVPGSAAPTPPTWDEEHPEHVPGSFLSALPQFFVFPMILVVTLTSIYFGLRWMAGNESGNATELLAEMRMAGPHSRWQAAQTLAEGLARGHFDLADVTTADLSGTYDALVPSNVDGLTERALEDVAKVRGYLLHVMSFKRDTALAPYYTDALQAEQGEIRMAGIAAYKRLADPTTSALLLPLLASESDDERVMTISALGSLGTAGSTEALDALAGLLGGDNTLDHRNAVLALAACNDPRAAPYLLPMLSRESYAQDPALLHANQAITDESSRKAAREETIEAFLVNSARAAAQLADPSLTSALQALRANDPSTKVQSAAINALHDLGAITES